MKSVAINTGLLLLCAAIGPGVVIVDIEMATHAAVLGGVGGAAILGGAAIARVLEVLNVAQASDVEVLDAAQVPDSEVRDAAVGPCDATLC